MSDVRESRPALLPDISAMSLTDLFVSEDTALAVAVRRVVSDVEAAAQAISGWSSFVDNHRDDEEVPGG